LHLVQTVGGAKVGRARLAAIAAAVVGLDQLTKFLVVRSLDIGESRPIIDGVLRLSHVRNSGAAFGTFRGFSGLLALAAVVGLVMIVGLIVRRPSPMTGLGAALVAAGAFGNLIDRLFRGPFARGTVVDFIDPRFWPSFNVADSAITIGALLIVVAGFLERPQAHKDRA
jgi:signal peptidase II